jgi:alkylation response protein AidB-like acyl-CoA dehydrogenase
VTPVHFDLDDDERALAAGIRELCRGRLPEPAPFDRATWQALHEAGVFALRIPEADGGLGLGMAAQAVVFEELGRALAAGPLIGTALAAGTVAGTTVGLAERAERPLLIEHLEVLDALVVLDASGVWAVDPRRVDGRPVPRPLDPLTPLHRVGDLPQGEQVAGADTAAAWRRRGAVLAAALLLGIADDVSARATAYAKEREQFARPIGSFQAVKHLLADTVVRTEVTRAAVYSAAVHLDDPGAGDLDTAVATAKLLAGEHALANAKTAVQVHGGMGFTWEVPVHFSLKRAALLATVCGDADAHAEVLAAVLD